MGSELALASRPWLAAAVPGLVFAGVMVVAAVTFSVVAPRFRRVREAFDVIVRCRDGHLYTTLWMPLGSLKAVRLGVGRYQRCPVGHHWSIVTPVDPGTLSDREVRAARNRHDAAVI